MGDTADRFITVSVVLTVLTHKENWGNQVCIVSSIDRIALMKGSTKVPFIARGMAIDGHSKVIIQMGLRRIDMKGSLHTQQTQRVFSTNISVATDSGVSCMYRIFGGNYIVLIELETHIRSKHHILVVYRNEGMSALCISIEYVVSSVSPVSMLIMCHKRKKMLRIGFTAKHRGR